MFSTFMNFDWRSASSLQLGAVFSLLAVGLSLVYSRIQQKKEENSSNDAPPVPAKPEKSADCVVLVIGAGTIGASFASVFLSQGKKVHVYDPFVTRETTEKRIREYWPFLVSRGITSIQEPPFGTTAFAKTDSLEDALAEIQKQGQTIEFVQEA
jgi:lactate dehydrogenase-like 2-hydroxyacid dehydrogenase